jgi:transcriptional regulator with XRE-family HTH domain
VTRPTSRAGNEERQDGFVPRGGAINGGEAFGSCLRELLRARRWTAVDLAARLHVDPSLVRRWLRGDRVPALGSRHVERIAAALELTDGERRRLEATQIARLRASQAGAAAVSTWPGASDQPRRPTFDVGGYAWREAAERPGDRRLVAAGLSDLAIPPAWLDQRRRWSGASAAPAGRLDRLLAAQRGGLAALRDQLGAFHFREICWRPALERFAREGVPAGGPPLLAGLLQLDAADRAELLLHASELLEAHQRLEIAPVDEADDLPAPTVAWGVKGDHVAFIWPAGAAEPPVWIAEPTIVAAFQDHFDDLWERIAPRSRDRRLVARWLRELAAIARR